jgi:hypothetical protein
MRVIDYLNHYLTKDEQRRFRVNIHLETTSGFLSYNPVSYDEYVMTEVSDLSFIGHCFLFSTTEEGLDYWRKINSRDVPLNGTFILKHIKQHTL